MLCLRRLRPMLSQAGPSNYLSPLMVLDLAAGLCDDLAHRPLTPQAMILDIPNDDDQRDLDDWCATDTVSLPTAPLPASDGSIQALTDNEQRELNDDLRSGHVSKSNLCPGCLESEGPRQIHRTIRDIDKATHTCILT